MGGDEWGWCVGGNVLSGWRKVDSQAFTRARVRSCLPSWGVTLGRRQRRHKGTVKRRGIDDPLFAYARLAGTSPLRLPLDERLDRFRGHTDPFEPRVDTRDAEAGSGSEASTVKISIIISSPDHNHESVT